MNSTGYTETDLLSIKNNVPMRNKMIAICDISVLFLNSRKANKRKGDNTNEYYSNDLHKRK